MSPSESRLGIRRTLSRAAATVGAAACLFLPATAEADRKSYHAGFCQAILPTKSLHHFSHSATNNTSGTVGVTCPLIRDRTGSSAQILSAAVEVYNNGGSFFCYLITQNEDLNGYSWDIENQSTTLTGHQQLNFSGPATTPGNEGAYAVGCEVPSLSSILHIYVNEDDAGD
jgi:hypothetical protein